MAVTTSLLTSGGSQSDASSYATDSFSPTAGRVVLACIYNNESVGGGVPPVPSLSGNNLTWTQVATQVYDIISGEQFRLTIFLAFAAGPTSGALTINFSGNTQNDCGWIIHEFTGLKTGGVNGAAAIVQSAGAEAGSGATSISVTLSAFAKPSNLTFGFIQVRGNTDVSPGGDFIELTEDEASHLLQTQWKQSSDTGVDWSWSIASNHVAAIALELNRQPAGGGFLFNLI